MILTTSGGVPVVIEPVKQGSTITVFSITFDLITHQFSIHFQGGGIDLSDSGNIPAALQTALENHCQARVEAALGISGTTITSP